MIAETYLERIKMIDTLIQNKKREYVRWVNAADGMGGASSGDRVQATRNLHRGADAIGSYIDLEAEIRALEQEKSGIIHTLESLPRVAYDILHRIYVQGELPKEIAFEYGRSYEWVMIQKRQAIALLQKLLDERT